MAGRRLAGLRPSAPWLLVVLVAAGLRFEAAPARAAGMAEFYQANAIVTGTDMRQRPWGFAQCLREVLVKVSGDPRLRHDRRVAVLAAHADRYVAAFDYVDMMAGIPRKDDQGSYDRPHKLTVRFGPATIAALLAQLGEQPWRGPRPVVVPVLLVRGPKPPAYLLSAEAPAGTEQRGAFVEAAGEFGMAVREPSEAELKGWGVAADRFPFPETPPARKPVATVARPADAAMPKEAIVLGTLTWSETLPGWVGKWRLKWRGDDHAWGVSGVNYDAAFRDIVAGVELLASGRGSPD